MANANGGVVAAACDWGLLLDGVAVSGPLQEIFAGDACERYWGDHVWDGDGGAPRHAAAAAGLADVDQLAAGE
jgi:hypothetical protein